MSLRGMKWKRETHDEWYLPLGYIYLNSRTVWQFAHLERKTLWSATPLGRLESKGDGA